MAQSLQDRVQKAGWLILAASLVYPLVTVWNSSVDGDCPVYREAASTLLSGAIPYRDRPLEYPPYALPFFLLPRLLSSTADGFVRAFAAEMLLIDVLVKLLLLTEGRRIARGFRGLLPLVVFAVDGWLQEYLYLKRFDLVPSGLVAIAMILFFRGRSRLAGAAIAAGIGVKLYPAVLLPTLLALAARQKTLRDFARGLAIGFVPLALVSFVLPWWRFLAFHAGRGLQVESIAASVVWWLHRIGVVDAQWAHTHAWYEVSGPIAEALRMPSKVAFAIAVLASAYVATRAVLRDPPPNISRGARRLLLPLLAFITFNTVLSPQYLIWSAPLVALAALEVTPAFPILMLSAAALIPLYYPGRAYYTGLPLLPQTALLIRNGMLVTAWALLFRDARREVEGVQIQAGGGEEDAGAMVRAGPADS